MHLLAGRKRQDTNDGLGCAICGYVRMHEGATVAWRHRPKPRALQLLSPMKAVNKKKGRVRLYWKVVGFGQLLKA